MHMTKVESLQAESAERTTDAEFCGFLSKRRMEYPEILAQKFIFYPRPWKHLEH